MMADRSIRAVIFDLDGTLLDTVQDIGAGANTALHRSGFPEHPIEDYVRFVGHGIKVLFRQACPEGTLDKTIDEVNRIYQDYYPANCTVHTVFFPGIEKLMKDLQQEGFLLGILSNKTEKTTLKIVEHYFPDTPFSLVWGNNGIRPLKPETDAGELLCKTLQLKPEEILYVGDGDTDMEFASKMGFHAVGVSWGYRSREQLKESGADVIVDSADEILKLAKA